MDYQGIFINECNKFKTKALHWDIPGCTTGDLESKTYPKSYKNDLINYFFELDLWTRECISFHFRTLHFQFHLKQIEQKLLNISKNYKFSNIIQ